MASLVAPQRTQSRRALVGTDWSVLDAYRGSDRRWRTSDPRTVAGIRAHLGIHEGDDSHPLVLQPGDALPHDAAEIATEDNRVIPALRRVTDALPFGYHQLHTKSGRSRALIVSPGKCVLPEAGWGIAAQLYAARSRQSWGIGDASDLRTVEQWCGRHGASFVLINPLHATHLSVPVETSPYFPASRRWRNPIYLDVERIDGASSFPTITGRLAAAARALNTSRRIDYDAVAQLKIEALQLIWADTQARDKPEFQLFVQTGGEDLQRYATFCALSDRFGPSWSSWPNDLRDVTSPSVTSFAREHYESVLFHSWLQYLLELQFAEQGNGVRVMHDLAIGVARHGADTWVDPSLYALDYSVGAPPDEFTVLGQDWGLPPFDPSALVRDSYQPFIAILRSALRAGRALRFDHVMGLFRLWWIPPGHSPADGAYVRYPARDLLNILALESHRSQGWIVGETLGTVEAGVSPELRRRNVLTYSLLVREGALPIERYPAEAMATVMTHDHPTLAGLWLDSDLREQEELKLFPNVKGTLARKKRLIRLTGLDKRADLASIVREVHKVLARAPSRLVAASLADIALQEERANMPGTTSMQRDNWRIPLPAPLEEVLAGDLATSVAQALNARGKPQATDV